MTAPAQVRIVSEGTFHTTGVWVNGELLDNVTAVRWTVGDDGYATALLEVEGVQLDVSACTVEQIPTALRYVPTHLYIPWDGPGCACCPAQPEVHPKTLAQPTDGTQPTAGAQ